MKTFPIILGAAFLQYARAAPDGALQGPEVPPDPCHGVYYESTNMLQINCFSGLDVLLEQSSTFYEFQLETDCYNVTFGDIEPLIHDLVYIPELFNEFTPLQCCDYYQRTVGYVFTDCD